MPLTERDYDLLSLYIDDALTPPERRAVESRLASDIELRAELDALRQTIALLKSLPEMVAPRDLRLTPKIAADSLAELKSAQPAARPRRTVVQMLTTFAAAAASLVLVLAGALTLMQPQMPTGTSATVAVADVMLTEKISTETPILETDADTSTGMILRQATLVPDATDGFGGAVDPMMDMAEMEMDSTGVTDIFSAVPAPVVAPQDEPPGTVQEEAEAPGDSAFMPGTPRPPMTPTLSAVGSVGHLELTATEDAGLSSRTFAVAPPGALDVTPALTEGALAEMSMPPATLDSAAEIIETAVADTEEDRAVQNEAVEQAEAAPITEPSSPILGFGLIIVGIALGVVALIMVVRG